ncbi:MAG: hypothetical protein ABI901_00595, partial [Roseiflexaceae bacterium]
MFPYDHWNPLSVAAVQHLFHDAPFRWGIAGGYAVEQFLGTAIRDHNDIDIILFRDDQQALHTWLSGWHVYAADPPGTLREWNASEWLSPGIHDIWCYRHTAQAWQLQMMLVETDGADWVSRRHPMIRGSRTDLIVDYHQIPCIRIEVQLLYKAKGNREKDRQDFHACLPKLSAEAKAWLIQALRLAH